MKRIALPLIIAFSFFSTKSNAQVGINTTTPTSTLDIIAKNATGSTSNVDGLLIPRVDRQRAQTMTTIPTSTLIYINNAVTGTQTGFTANVDAVGYYYFDGSAWVKLHNPSNSTFSSVNIYNTDGSLTGNRIVTQAANTLAFTGTAANAFSVDGTTLSVDAANNRVGIGTVTPENKFQVVTTTAVANRFSLIDAPTGTTQFAIMALRNTSPAATGNYALLGFTNAGSTIGGAAWGIGSVRTAAAEEDFFFGNSLGSSYLERMRITSAGLIGIGTATPQKKVHITGSLQLTNEFNVGGNATTAGSAGTTGQILTSAGAGAAPSWQNVPTDLNIYNSDGSLTGNRIVTQGTNTLAFTSNAVNGFSVDGSTFSVDALNNRVGVGTAAPHAQLHLGSSVANRKIVMYETGDNDHEFYGFGVNGGIMRYQADRTTTDHVFYAGVTGGASSNELMRIKGTGNVGIGTSTPAVRLDVAQPIGTSEATQLRIINTSPVAANNTAYIGFNSYNAGGASWGIGSIQNSTTITDNNFHILYSSGGAYGKVFTIRPNTGFVGIGTTTPSNMLHVNGTNPLRLEGLQASSGKVGTLVVNSTGVVQTQTSADISAARATGSLTLASNNVTILTNATAAPTETFDNLNEFSGATFTAAAAGLYKVDLSINFDQRASSNDSGDGYMGYAFIYLNGTSYSQAAVKVANPEISGAPTYQTSTTNTVVKMAAGNTLTFNASNYGSTGGNTANYTINIVRID